MNILSFSEWCRFDEKRKKSKDLRKPEEIDKDSVKKKPIDPKVIRK